MKNASTRMNLAVLLAATMGAFGHAGASSIRTGTVTPKAHSYVPTMVTASREEIAAWNAAIEAKKQCPTFCMHRKPYSVRQKKRTAYVRHEGYAERHPAIAARYSF